VEPELQPEPKQFWMAGPGSRAKNFLMVLAEAEPEIRVPAPQPWYVAKTS